MSDKPCYKEDSLRDFALWAASCGHYTVAPLIDNYQEYLKNVKNRDPEPPGPPLDD
jgi:hypothetical protein